METRFDVWQRWVGTVRWVGTGNRNWLKIRNSDPPLMSGTVFRERERVITKEYIKSLTFPLHISTRV